LNRHHQVLIVGGGWSGVSAAIAAKTAGADVGLCERTDMLLGAGLVGGIMRNNGRLIATGEAIAMGFGDLFHLTESASRHKNIAFPGHKHASLYDVMFMEPLVRKLLESMGIAVYSGQRVVRLISAEAKILSVESEIGDRFHADSFVDATGSSGPPGQCARFGNGCACCIQRCPSYGPRVSLTSLLGLPEFMCTRRAGNYGAMSGSCKLHKESLSQDIASRLDAEGVVVVPLPKSFVNASKLATKVCQQYALPEYAENIVLLDTGHAKLMSPFFPLSQLRSLEGFENARYADPLAGDRGNSIRLTAISPRDDFLKVDGAQNLFVGGERVGVCVGHTEAIVTGAVAGRNAALQAHGKPLTALPTSMATGDFIARSGIGPDGSSRVPGGYGLQASHTFAGSVYFQRMKDMGLYVPDLGAIARRVRDEAMENAFLT
jgi:hypothetical protein